MLLALLPAAFAVDLDLVLETPTHQTTSLTFHDVERHAPPPFTVVEAGRPLRVTVSVAPAGANWAITTVIASVRPGLWAERVKPLLSPTITMPANQPGYIKQGRAIRFADLDSARAAEYIDYAWRLEFTVRAE